MALTPEQMKARKGLFTASCANTLLNGTPAKVLNMFYQFVESPAYVEPDLSGVWPVQLGSVTEQLNLDWYVRKTSHAVSRRGEVVVSPEYKWAGCTLDGWDAVDSFPIECKHVGGWEPFDRIVTRYQPQLHWQMIVTERDSCAISVIEGAKEPVVEIVNYSDDYGSALFARANAFMQCVASGIPPIAANDNIVPPERITRVVDMTGNNLWSTTAGDWLANKGAADICREAEKVLKMVMPADAVRTHGHGVEITRDRAGRLHLRSA